LFMKDMVAIFSASISCGENMGERYTLL